MHEEIRQTYRRTKQGYSAMVEIAWEQKRRQKEKIVEQAYKARALPTCTQQIQGRWAHSQRDSEGVVWWWGEKGVYTWFPAVTFFKNIPY